MFNKRGQEGVSTIGWIIGAGILVVLVVLVVLWQTGFFGKLTSGTNTVLTEDLEIKAQACIISAEASLVTDYCKGFDEVEIVGVKHRVNCQYPDLQASIEAAQSEDGFDIPSCGTIEEESVAYCGKLKTLNPITFKNDLRVNTKTCEEWGVVKNAITSSDNEETLLSCTDENGLNGDLANPGTCGESETELTEGFLEAKTSSNVCCVSSSGNGGTVDTA